MSDFCGYYLRSFAILRSQQLFNEGDSPHLFAWFSSTLNKKTNSDKLQFLSLLSAVSCVTESIVPGHITHSAILNLEGEANSSARKETGQGNAIATFSPLTRQSNGPRLVTLFAKRNVSKRATFSLPIVYDSNKKSLSEFAEIYTALLISSIVSVVGPRVLSEQADYSIWEQRVTIDALKSICAFLSTSFIPIVSIQSVSKALQSTIEEGVQQIQEAKETAFKSFTRAATGSHYQPPFRSSQKTPNSFSPTFFSRKSPSRESRTQVTRPSVYGELSLLERAAERALDTHEKDLGPQIDVFSATLATVQETTLNNSHILQVEEEQHNISFDIKESRNTSHWIVFSAALLYAQDSPPFLLAHTSRALPHIETFEWSVLRSVEAVLIAKKEELKFAFKNSSSAAGLSFPVFLPTQPNLDYLTNTSTDEVNASDIKHHGEEALLRSPLKNNLQIILHWRPVVSLNHSMALLESQSPLSNDAKEVDENFVVTLLLIASERSEGDVHENIDVSLRKNIAHILLSTAGTLAASESLSLLARASSTLPRSESGSGEILESMRA